MILPQWFLSGCRRFLKNFASLLTSLRKKDCIFLFRDWIWRYIFFFYLLSQILSQIILFKKLLSCLRNENCWENSKFISRMFLYFQSFNNIQFLLPKKSILFLNYLNPHGTTPLYINFTNRISGKGQSEIKPSILSNGGREVSPPLVNDLAAVYTTK